MKGNIKMINLRVGDAPRTILANLDADYMKDSVFTALHPFITKECSKIIYFQDMGLSL